MSNEWRARLGSLGRHISGTGDNDRIGPEIGFWRTRNPEDDNAGCLTLHAARRTDSSFATE